MRNVFTKAALLFALGITAVLFGLVTWASVSNVQRSAERIAGDDPYCVQTLGKGSNLAEVSTWTDIAFFKMRSPDAYSNHAVLIVDRVDGTELLHWSYRERSFMPGALGPPAIHCSPRPHFLETMSGSYHSESSASTFRVEGMTLSIPASFNPAVWNRGLTFYARVPQFGPPPATSPNEMLDFVEVTFGRRAGFLDRNPPTTDANHLVQTEGSEHALNKLMVTYLRGHSPPHPEYFAYADDDRISTVISCGGVPEADCMHAFYDGTWTYIFHHREKLLPDWKPMQDQLSSIARSFVISGSVEAFETELQGTYTVFKFERVVDPTSEHFAPHEPTGVGVDWSSELGCTLYDRYGAVLRTSREKGFWIKLEGNPIRLGAKMRMHDSEWRQIIEGNGFTVSLELAEVPQGPDASNQTRVFTGDIAITRSGKRWKFHRVTGRCHL